VTIARSAAVFMWLARLSCVNVDAKYGKRLKNICLDISLLRKDIHLFGANIGVILDVPYCSIHPDINPFQHLHMVCTLLQYTPWHKPLPTPTHTLLQYTSWHKPVPSPTHGLYPTAVYPLTLTSSNTYTWSTAVYPLT